MLHTSSILPSGTHFLFRLYRTTFPRKLQQKVAPSTFYLYEKTDDLQKITGFVILNLPNNSRYDPTTLYPRQVEGRGILLTGGGALLHEAVHDAAVFHVFRPPHGTPPSHGGAGALCAGLGGILAHEENSTSRTEGQATPVDDPPGAPAVRQHQMPDDSPPAAAGHPPCGRDPPDGTISRMASVAWESSPGRGE